MYFDMALDSEFVEAVLEHAKVVHELVVVFGFPIDFGEVDFAGVDDVEDLAVDAATAQLLDLGNVELPRPRSTLRRLLIQLRISVRGTKYPSSIIPKLSLV